jgi:hypothetical protein
MFKQVILQLLKGLGKQALLYILHYIVDLLEKKHDLTEYEYSQIVSFKTQKNA